MLIQRLRGDQLTARKNRDQVATSLLTALVGEAAMVGKNNGNRESTDDEVVATVKKFLKNAEETFGHAQNRGSDDLSAMAREIEILKGYLPQQMTRDEIRSVIERFKNDNPGANMGLVMKFLKENHGGSYDGKLASEVAKEVL